MSIAVMIRVAMMDTVPIDQETKTIIPRYQYWFNRVVVGVVAARQGQDFYKEKRKKTKTRIPG